MQQYQNTAQGSQYNLQESVAPGFHVYQARVKVKNELYANSMDVAIFAKYPSMARENNITGRVIVSFVVEKNGDLTDIKVLRGIGGGCDEEAVRVLKTAPSWKPGIQNGRPVRVAYTMPIFFQLAQ
jgi:TonB family protein